MHTCGMKQANCADARSVRELLSTKTRCSEPLSKAENPTFTSLVHVPEQEKPDIQIKMLNLIYQCGDELIIILTEHPIDADSQPKKKIAPKAGFPPYTSASS